MTRDQMLAEIRSKGHWRVNFRPLSPDDRIETLNECYQAIDRSRVTARGWDYPHIPTNSRGDDSSAVEWLENCVEGWDDWRDHRELWRMYESSQFIHIKALHEDWSERDLYLSSVQPPPPVLPTSTLSVFYQSWTVTEMFIFLSRLATQGLYKSGAEVSISLVNTADRSLHIDDQRRVPLHGNYRTGAQRLTFHHEFSRMQIADPTVRATEALLYFFQKFRWTPAAEQVQQMIAEQYPS